MSEINTLPEFKDTYVRNQIRTMLDTGMKVLHVRDSAGRIEEVYEAPLHATVGSPCLRTQMKYADGSGGNSRSIIAYIELVVAWPGFEPVAVGAGNDFDLIP